MEESVLIDFLKERLGNNFLSAKVEKMSIPVSTNGMCVVLKQKVVICHVKDEAKALNSLWRFATDGLPMLFVTYQRSAPLLLKDMYAEVFGSSVDKLDLHNSTALKHIGTFLDDFSDAKIYIDDSAKNLQAKSVKELLFSQDVKLVVTDLQ